MVVADRSKYSGAPPHRFAFYIVRGGTDCGLGSAMHPSDPAASSATSGHGSTQAAAAALRSRGPAAPEFRLQPDFHWTRSLSERVRGMRDSALAVVWKKRREQKLRGTVRR